MIEKASGCWIGRIGPWRHEGWPMSEIGWALCRSATGRGYAREGAAAAIDCAVDTLGWTDFGHVIVPENAASIRLARRFGFPIPTAGKRADVWAQTAAGWRAWRQGGG